MYLPHGGKLTILNFVTRIRTRIRSSSINGMALVCVMKYRSLFLVLLIIDRTLQGFINMKVL